MSNLEVGIVGLPNVGKSTLFNAITKAGAEAANYPFCTIEPNVGIVDVPDKRLQVLHEMYNSKKTTPAAFRFVDIAGLVKGAANGEGLGNKFLEHIRQVDAVAQVVRCFESGDITHVEGSIDPLRDIDIINTELCLADMEVLERRLAKLVKLQKSGAITDEEAKARRQRIQDESAFFGAMDGATKYVKGDATAGLIITLINLVGGTAMGVMRQGLEFGGAIQQYGILTIGDGLVSQIPSLLISLATGILVTKGSSEADFSGVLVRQLFGIPKVLYIVGVVLMILAFTPLNTLLFIGLGAAFVLTGRAMDKSIGEESIVEEAQVAEEEAEEIRKPENVVSLLSVDPIELEFGYGIIPLADVNQGGDLLDRVVMIRRQIALEMGTVVPIIRLRDNIQLNPNQYIIMIKGIQVTEGEILFDHYMAMNPGYVEEEITGIPTFEPSFHLPAIWITESQRERAESLGYTVVDPPSIIATHLTEVIRNHIAELLTRQDVQNLVNNLKESNPVLVEELIPKLLGLGEVQKVLQNLLSEGISIRDLLTIFETLADHAQTTRDTDVLTEYVRQSLKRAISNKYFPGNETTSVVTLDPKIEQEIMSSVKQTEQGAYLTLDPDRTRAIIDSVKAEVEKMEGMGKPAIVITSPIVRMYFKKMTEDYVPDLIVVSYNEIESNVELQSIGMVTA